MIKRIAGLVGGWLLGNLLFYPSDLTAHRNSAMNLECGNCHIEGKATKVIIKGFPSQFQPGRSYTITVEVQSKVLSVSESKGGFAAQVVGGTLKIKDDKNTQLLHGYLTHTQEGNTKRKWVFEWVAPQDAEEAVLTVMGVAANGDYSPYGDGVAVEALSAKKAVTKAKK